MMNSFILLSLLAAIILLLIIVYFINSKRNKSPQKTLPAEKKLEVKLVSPPHNNSSQPIVHKQPLDRIRIEDSQLQLRPHNEAVKMSATEFETQIASPEIKPELQASQANEKRISELEEQIDELQFDLDDALKISNKHKRSAKLATEAFEELQRKTSKIESEIKDMQIQLQKKDEELSSTVSNITAANCFLNAPVEDNEKTLDFHKSIDRIVDHVRLEVLPRLRRFNEIDSVEQKLYTSKILQWGNLQKKYWLKNKKAVAFVGEYSAGKTSIINKIIAHDSNGELLLPVHSKATTAIATYISPNEIENFQFTDENGVLRKMNRTVFETVKKDLFSQIKLSSLINHFVVSYKVQNPGKLSILDTPGFNSNDKEDAQRTAAVIQEVDALFWVFDANAGEINKTSIEIIKEHLKDIPLFVIINKIDTKAPNEIVALKEHISSTLSSNEIDVKEIIEFSHKLDPSIIISQITALEKTDSSDTLLEIISKLREEITEAENESIRAKEQRRKLKEELREKEEEIDENLKKISSKTERLIKLPERKERWLSSDYYKLSEMQYERMTSLLQQIDEHRKEIVELQEYIINEKLREKYEKQDKIYKDEYYQKDSFVRIKEQLGELIANSEISSDYIGEVKSNY